MQRIIPAAANDSCPLVQLVHADDLERVMQRLEHSRESGLTCRGRFRLKRPAGHWFEAIAAPERVSGGGTLWNGFLSDVTCDQGAALERRALLERPLEALRRDKLAAEKASLGKSEFVSWVSHELRTPLNGILGFAQLMMLDREHPLAPVQLRRLEILQQSGTRLQALVDQLLILSRVEHGHLKLRLKGIDLEPLIERCLDIVTPLANAHGVEVSIEAAHGFVPVRADADALEQVVLNLLLSAIKYNRANGQVAVRFETAERGVLTVEDTGVGMTDSQLGRLFEPFNRLGAERTTTTGSGLGLVISRNLVQAMGGTMEVWSEPGSGSRFAVSLPLTQRLVLPRAR